MIVTLTPNTGIDHTVRLSHFQLNSTIRALDSAWGMGGKATDASWTLGKIGVPSLALGFAAGPNGVRMEKMLQERGTKTDFVWVEGETRLNTVIVTEEGQSTITSSSLVVSPHHLAKFTTCYQNALEGASCVVMGGSLPYGVPIEFYADAIEQAHSHHVPVIFDSSGPSLLAGVKSRPEIIKPNLAEVGDLLGFVPSAREEIQQAAVRLHEELHTSVILTAGAEGAIAAFDEATYLVEPLPRPVVSAAGAGDGVLAGMALAYLHKEPLEYGLRHGFALAAAILGTLATADLRVEEYQELLPQICIRRLG